MAKDLASLRADMKAWSLNNSTEINANQDTIINNALRMLYRKLRIRQMNFVNTSISLAVGTSNYTYPLNTTLLSVTGFYSITASRRTPLIKKTLSYVNEFWPDRTQTGTPRYYAELDDDELVIVPTPSAIATTEMTGRAIFDDLAQTTDTNWLITNHYDVALAAVMVEAAGFVIDDRKDGMLAFWVPRLQDGIADMGDVAKRIEVDGFRKANVDAKNAPASAPASNGDF